MANGEKVKKVKNGAAVDIGTEAPVDSGTVMDGTSGIEVVQAPATAVSGESDTQEIDVAVTVGRVVYSYDALHALPQGALLDLVEAARGEQPDLTALKEEQAKARTAYKADLDKARDEALADFDRQSAEDIAEASENTGFAYVYGILSDRYPKLAAVIKGPAKPGIRVRNAVRPAHGRGVVRDVVLRAIADAGPSGCQIETIRSALISANLLTAEDAKEFRQSRVSGAYPDLIAVSGSNGQRGSKAAPMTFTLTDAGVKVLTGEA